MSEKRKFNAAALIALVVVIIVIASAYAVSYSSLSSRISSDNQKISELNGMISDQNKTIFTQNSTISSLRTNETIMSLIISTLQSEISSTNGNYSRVNLLLGIAEQKYGISTNMLFYNYTITVAPKTDMLFIREINPSNNTTLFFISPMVASHGTMGSVNGTIYNLTLLLNSTASSGASFNVQISEPNYAFYINNENNNPVTFSFTMFLMWRL